MKNCQNQNNSQGTKEFKTTDLLKLIISTIVSTAIPLIPIPTMLLLLGAKLRPGISPRKIAERTLLKYSEAGIPVGPMYGKENLIAKAVEADAYEMTYAITKEGKVESVIDPGGIQVTVVGANAGGPITASGMNTNVPRVNGVIS